MQSLDLGDSKVTGSYMSLRNFADLEPLASDLACRTLTLPVDHLPGKGPLPAKSAPRAVRRDVLSVQLEQQQIGRAKKLG